MLRSSFQATETGTQTNTVNKTIEMPHRVVKMRSPLQARRIQRTWNNRRYCQRIDSLHRAEVIAQNIMSTQTAYIGFLIRRTAAKRH